MKNVLLLSGILLCAAGAYAESSRADQIAEGRKRNEEIYERSLEQTGWINQKVSKQDTRTETAPMSPSSSQPKSS